jgi:hypothetical protein
MANVKQGETLIAFKSGHYKTVKGDWTGDTVWMHFEKPDGGRISINKAEVEYIETSGPAGGVIPDITKRGVIIGGPDDAPESVLPIFQPGPGIPGVKFIGGAKMRDHNLTPPPQDPGEAGE